MESEDLPEGLPPVEPESTAMDIEEPPAAILKIVTLSEGAALLPPSPSDEAEDVTEAYAVHAPPSAPQQPEALEIEDVTEPHAVPDSPSPTAQQPQEADRTLSPAGNPASPSNTASAQPPPQDPETQIAAEPPLDEPRVQSPAPVLPQDSETRTAAEPPLDESSAQSPEPVSDPAEAESEAGPPPAEPAPPAGAAPDANVQAAVVRSPVVEPAIRAGGPTPQPEQGVPPTVGAPAAEDQPAEDAPAARMEAVSMDVDSTMEVTGRRWWEGSVGFDFRDEIISNHLNKDDCDVCGLRGELLCCDGPCLRSFHMDCIKVQQDDVPDGDWFCTECAALPDAKAQRKYKEKQVLHGKGHTVGVEDPADKRAKALRKELYESPSRYDAFAKDRIEAVTRGLNFIFKLAGSKDSSNFAQFGSDIMQTFYDVATVAHEPLRKYALHRLEEMAQWWKERYQRLTDIAGAGDDADDEDIEAHNINDAIMGVYALERVGITHPLKIETRNFVKAEKFTCADYLGGFDPRTEKPDVIADVSPYRAITTALASAYYADRVGIDLGAKLSDVLQHVEARRPYKTETEMGDFGLWSEQLTMIFNIVHVASNFGELRLSPAMLPHEAEQVLSPRNLQVAIQEDDVCMAGELCHCMRVFGAEEGHVLLDKGLNFLMKMQNLDGSWKAPGNSKDPYTRYFAAMTAVTSLHPPHFRGFGPGDLPVYQLSDKWQRKHNSRLRQGKLPGPGMAPGVEYVPPSLESLGVVAAMKKRARGRQAKGGKTKDGAPEEPATMEGPLYVLPEDAVRTKLTGCGVFVEPLAVSGDGTIMDKGLEAVRADYKGTSHGEGGDLNLDLRERAQRRLLGLLKWRNNNPSLAQSPDAGPLKSAKPTPQTRVKDAGRWARNSKQRAPPPPPTTHISHRDATQRSAEALTDRTQFEAKLRELWSGRGQEEQSMTVMCGQFPVDLFQLYQRVASRGGLKAQKDLHPWLILARQMEIPSTMADRATRLKQLYEEYLAQFEALWAQRCQYQLKGSPPSSSAKRKQRPAADSEDSDSAPPVRPARLKKARSITEED